MNRLYYGDNLRILQEYISDSSVDLIYLDPPFNSKADYSIQEKSGEESIVQITAFQDTWHWGEESEYSFSEICDTSPQPVVDVIRSLRGFLGTNDMMAYLVMMAIRLVELRRVLKNTGSLYLHCDPTASHYLKIILDSVFGKENYINEITWKRSQTRSSISRRFRKARDILLFYSKTNHYDFHLQYKKLSRKSLELYKHKDDKGYYRLVPILVSGKTIYGITGRPWRGIDPSTRGKQGMHWVTVHENLERYDQQGRIVWPGKKNGLPQLKYYLEENPGVPVNDFWDDIAHISSSSKEMLEYPTQKPIALLDRIIQASCPEGGIVLDPFCGCGTAIISAENLRRRWIGIDITHLATALIKDRLKDSFRLLPKKDYEVIGEPEDLESAKNLAKDNRYQFQWWVCSIVGARPYQDKKKGRDTGIDGIVYFRAFEEEMKEVKIKIAILQVKSGKVGVKDIRELAHVRKRESAEIALFVSLNPPTSEMTKEAISEGYYLLETQKARYPRIQILTIEEYFEGKMPELPDLESPYKKSVRSSYTEPELNF